MNTPQQPKDPPSHPKPVDPNPESPIQNGIPDGAKTDEATALPDSGRQQTETAANESS